MIYFAASIIAIVSFLGVGLTLLTLPGIWISLAAAILVKVLWQPEIISWNVLIVAMVLGVLAEVAELVASAAGSSRAGGSKHGAIWSIIGAIVGAIVGSIMLPIPIVGTVVGGVAGAGVAALGAEMVFANKPWREAAKIGQGAAVGRLLSTVIKTAFSAAIAIILSVAAFF
ncbi:MAG: DUF456 domain-containing protein [Planctomycetota bacterium]|nr:MAG: DUF456 domain-containing protein [Planctomycetota bacterium]